MVSLCLVLFLRPTLHEVGRASSTLHYREDFPLSYRNYRHMPYFDQLSNDFAYVRWCGSMTGLFACDLDDSRHATLEQAIARRDYLRSPEGKQEQLQREVRREARREYDLARDERRKQHSTARQFEHADDAADTVVFA